MKNLFLVFLFLISVSLCAQKSKPNIVIIYVDDLGYGDIGVNGAIGVKTPNVDALASNGINFTNAYATAATCTPSRYSLLTGSYAFRNNAAILNGDAPLIIDTEICTLPDMLKEAGYTTGVVGKWHLGLGDGSTDWNIEVKPGPREVGFDYSFLIPATGDRVPTVFLENQRVVGLDKNDPITVNYRTRIDGYPIGTEHPELLKQYADEQHLMAITNGISRIGYMKGGESALWVDEEIPFVLVDKATDFIEKQSENPFFLFFSLHDIHQPRIANVKFIEASSMGPRGDVIAQMDWCVGEITKKLDKLGLRENTLIVFTSDNGPILDDGYLDYARELVGNHKPGGLFRGSKYSVYEAGTRMPTVVNWPAKIKKSMTSKALLSQVDLYASLANLVGEPLKKNQAKDSENHINAWLGKTEKGRSYLFQEAYAYGLRMDNWKYIRPKKYDVVPTWLVNKFVDPGFSKEVQLYNLENDPAETKNVSKDYPEIVKRMEYKMEEILKK